MTIAAGFVCEDGVVLCSDSQETSGDYKSHVKKLVIARPALMLTGAGFGPALDAAIERIRDDLGTGSHTSENAKGRIRHILRDLHKNDLQYFPMERRDYLIISLLIAIDTVDLGPILLQVDGSLIKQVSNFVLRGTGDVVRFFAEVLYPKTGSLQIEDGRSLAAYLTFLAKSQLTNVGGITQMATLKKNGGLEESPEWEVNGLDLFLGAFNEASSKLIFECFNPNVSRDALMAGISKFSELLYAIKGHVMATVPAKEELKP